MEDNVGAEEAAAGPLETHKKHFEVQTGEGLWGKSGGGYTTRATGAARALEGVTSRGVTAGTQANPTLYDFYQPLYRTMMAGGKTKDVWTFGVWPPDGDSAGGEPLKVVGKVTCIVFPVPFMCAG